LINSRKTKSIDITNGERHFGTYHNINLGEFIPFYFGVRTPMLYVIQKGFNMVSKTKPEKIIYLVSSIQTIMDTNLNYYFSDGHATDMLTIFYDSSKINDIEQIVDFKATKAKFWKEQNDLDLKRRKEAEFLVEPDIPANCILGYFCYNEKAKSILTDLGIPENKVIIKPEYYF
jgi:hypothetical protein